MNSRYPLQNQSQHEPIQTSHLLSSGMRIKTDQLRCPLKWARAEDVR